MFPELVLFMVAIIACAWMFKKKDELSNIPGPQGWPLFGNIFDIDAEKPYIQFAKLSKNHGGLFKIKLMRTPILIASGYDELYDVLVRRGDDFSGRPKTFRGKLITENYSDFAFADLHPRAHSMKKTIMAQFKAYGSGLEQVEKTVCEITEKLVSKIKAKSGEQFEIFTELSAAVTDTIALFLLGRSLSAEEQDIVTRVRVLMLGIMGETKSGELLDAFPWLRNLGNPTWKKIQEQVSLRADLYRRWHNETRDKMAAGENVDHNLIATMLKIINGENKFGFNDDTISSNAWMLFMAGVNTSTHTLLALINLLTRRPDLQEKLQAECDHALGDRDPVLSDRTEMPFHQAVIYEANRYVTIVPFGVPHTAVRDTEICGRVIPRGTTVWPNMWALHHDDKLWDAPFEFRPERYLDSAGCLVTADHPSRKRNLAFSAGPRVCPGSVFAQSRMFLILAMLTRHFLILPATTVEEQPSADCTDMIMGISLSTPYFKVRFQNRR